MYERELETEQNCSILTITLLAITAFLSRSPGLLNRGPGGPLYWVLAFSTALISNWSGLQTDLISNYNSSIGALRAHSAGCLLSLPHLLQLTDFLSSPSYIIVHAHLLLVGVTIALIRPINGQGYNSDIPRPDAPVIYTGAFPILTARPGRRSI